MRIPLRVLILSRFMSSSLGIGRPNMGSAALLANNVLARLRTISSSGRHVFGFSSIDGLIVNRAV
jgi:hypothetical protein